MEKKIQELENRIKQLESIVNRGNFLNAKQFDQNVIFKDGITVDNGRILVRSKNNPSGIYLATGAGRTMPLSWQNKEHCRMAHYICQIKHFNHFL